MAFNKAEKSDFPRKKGGMRRRKRFVYSVVRTM